MAALQVFVSCDTADSAFCHTLVDGLRGAGADVWYDEHSTGSGPPLGAIEQEIRKRPVFVVILSPAALHSQWVRDECEWACMWFKSDPARVIQPVVASALPGEDDIWMCLRDFKRIEAPGLQPLSAAEATRHLLDALALAPEGVAPAPSVSQPGESGDDLMERSKALVAQRRYGNALPLIERATQLIPDSFLAWFYLGVALSNVKQHASALGAYDRALALDPANTRAWVNKGAALDALGRFAEEAATYERALALDPADAFAWSNRGAALNRLGRYAEALEAMNRAMALDPTNPITWSNKGAALNGLGRPEEALAAYDQAVALDPASAAAWYNKGNALNGLGRPEEALAAYDQAVTLDPTYSIAWYNKGGMLEVLGALRGGAGGSGSRLRPQ